jgi:hypothetical protein
MSVSSAEAMVRQALSKVMIHHALCQTTLKLEWDDEDDDGTLARANSFLELSKGNTIVQEVYLDPRWYQNRLRLLDSDWEEKLGKMLGNLQSLKELKIEDSVCRDAYDEEPPEWESVARVLRHVWQKITVSVRIAPTRGSEEAFARAIRGHPTIQRFETDNSFHFDSFGILASALATLPSLESIRLHHAELDEELQPELLEDLPAIVHPECITTLLLSPSLRSVRFGNFYFPNPVCQVVALALRTGSPITCLALTYCDFHDGGAASIMYALQRNSTLKTLKLAFLNEYDESACGALTSVLLVNTTLMDLTVRVLTHTTPPTLRIVVGTWLHPFLVVLQMNTTLKKLNVGPVSLTDELVCAALRDVLVNNSVLEELTLICVGSIQGCTEVASFRSTLPFLRDNKTLKAFTYALVGEAMEPLVAPLCIDAAAILKDNTSLEILDIMTSNTISLNNYFAALESLQTNTTLKTLCLHPNIYNFSDDGTIQHFISLVKKNYGLESLDEGLIARDTTGELGTILRLNQAGRRYLIEDVAPVAKGVEVLVAVRDDLGCLFYHLLENPLLCDIEHRHVTTGTAADGPVRSNKRPRTSK